MKYKGESSKITVFNTSINKKGEYKMDEEIKAAICSAVTNMGENFKGSRELQEILAKAHVEWNKDTDQEMYELYRNNEKLLDNLGRDKYGDIILEGSDDRNPRNPVPGGVELLQSAFRGAVRNFDEKVVEKWKNIAIIEQMGDWEQDWMKPLYDAYMDDNREKDVSRMIMKIFLKVTNMLHIGNSGTEGTKKVEALVDKIIERGDKDYMMIMSEHPLCQRALIENAIEQEMDLDDFQYLIWGMRRESNLGWAGTCWGYRNEMEQHDYTALHLAVDKGKMDGVNKLLKMEYPYSPNKHYDKIAPIVYYAAQIGKKDIMVLLAKTVINAARRDSRMVPTRLSDEMIDKMRELVKGDEDSTIIEDFIEISDPEYGVGEPSKESGKDDAYREGGLAWVGKSVRTPLHFAVDAGEGGRLLKLLEKDYPPECDGEGTVLLEIYNYAMKEKKWEVVRSIVDSDRFESIKGNADLRIPPLLIDGIYKGNADRMIDRIYKDDKENWHVDKAVLRLHLSLGTDLYESRTVPGWSTFSVVGVLQIMSIPYKVTETCRKSAFEILADVIRLAPERYQFLRTYEMRGLLGEKCLDPKADRGAIKTLVKMNIQSLQDEFWADELKGIVDVVGNEIWGEMVAEAVGAKDKGLLEKYMKATGNVNALMADGKTALEFAVEGGEKDIVEVLVDSGADWEEMKNRNLKRDGDGQESEQFREKLEGCEQDKDLMSLIKNNREIYGHVEPQNRQTLKPLEKRYARTAMGTGRTMRYKVDAMLRELTVEELFSVVAVMRDVCYARYLFNGERVLEKCGVQESYWPYLAETAKSMVFGVKVKDYYEGGSNPEFNGHFDALHKTLCQIRVTERSAIDKVRKALVTCKYLGTRQYETDNMQVLRRVRRRLEKKAASADKGARGPERVVSAFYGLWNTIRQMVKEEGGPKGPGGDR